MRFCGKRVPRCSPAARQNLAELATPDALRAHVAPCRYVARGTMASLSPDKRRALEARLKAENEKSKLHNKASAGQRRRDALHARSCAAQPQPQPPRPPVARETPFGG